MEIVLRYQNGEAELIEACRRKERWAQRIIYETYYSPMMGVCMRYAKDSKIAEDVLHEAFIKIFNQIEKYKIGTSLTSWIKTIVINTSIDQYRKRKRKQTEDLDQIKYKESSSPSGNSLIIEKEILKCVQELPDTYRAIFNLYVMEGFSHREIADKLDISESTSRSNLVKARAKLRQVLKQKGIYNE